MIPAMNRSRLLSALGALLVAALAGACGTVKPWERGALAHASVDPSSNTRIASEDFLTHTFDVREGSSGGTGHTGGGCGCN